MEKQGSKKRVEKKKVTIGEMVSTTCYLGLHDRKIYRKLEDKLERLDNGKWEEVKINRNFLMSSRFREY